MRRNELDLQRYDTDKVTNRYLERYDPVLQHLVDRDVKLLELGIHKGGSLLLWRDYFPNGTITGVDLNVPPGTRGQERIRVFQGSQGDTAFLTEVANSSAPEGFDIIIDDASHLAHLTRTSFWHLFDNHLKPSGLYVIEDWGTGYWDDWPDGKAYRPRTRLRTWYLNALAKVKLINRIPGHNHSYGMVGLVKDLVDEQGAADLTRARLTGTAGRQSQFESMVITPSIVFIKKRSHQHAGEPMRRLGLAANRAST